MSELVETSDDSSDRKQRILICHTCKEIFPLPDYDGPADYDDTLLARVEQHQFPGERYHPHDLDLGRVSERSWDNPDKRKQIVAEVLKQTNRAGEGEGLGSEFYDVKSTFSEDAMKCWRFEHGRTSNCGDYKSDKKLLLAPTRGDRKELGLDPKARGRQYLCSYCPYESVVAQRNRKKAGLYN